MSASRASISSLLKPTKQWSSNSKSQSPPEPVCEAVAMMNPKPKKRRHEQNDTIHSLACIDVSDNEDEDFQANTVDDDDSSDDDMSDGDDFEEIDDDASFSSPNKNGTLNAQWGAVLQNPRAEMRKSDLARNRKTRMVSRATEQAKNLTGKPGFAVGCKKKSNTNKSDPTAVTAATRVKNFPNEFFCEVNRELYCNCCRTTVAKKKSSIYNHIRSKLHGAKKLTYCPNGSAQKDIYDMVHTNDAIRKVCILCISALYYHYML